MYCIDIEAPKFETQNINFETIKKILQSIPEWNIHYFGFLPDNDADGQEELIRDKTFIRLAAVAQDNIKKEAFINLVRSKLLFSEASPELEIFEDSAGNKKDTYIIVYFS